MTMVDARLSRVRRASDRADRAAVRLATERAEQSGAIRDAWTQGWSLRQLAQASGLSHEKIRQLVNGLDRAPRVPVKS